MTSKTFAAITGAVVGVTGIMGMISPLRKNLSKKRNEMVLKSGYGEIAGVIPTNTLFNWMRVGIGVAGLLSSQNEKSSVAFNRTVAVAYGGMAIMGLIPKANTTFGLMPIFGGNILLHSGTALAELFTEPVLLDKARNLVGIRKSTSPGQSLSSGGTFTSYNYDSNSGVI